MELIAMQPNLNSVGKRVAYARKLRSLTQHELADKAKIAQSSLATLEAERSKSSRNLVDIALALDVPPEWLATGNHSGASLNDIFLKAPAWDAPAADKNLYQLLKQAVPGEYSTASASTSTTTIHSSSIGLKLLAWTTTALLNPDNAYKRQLEQQNRFQWPLPHAARAFLLRVTRDFAIPELKEDDLILIDPEEAPSVGRNIIAIHGSDEIIVGRVMNTPSGKTLLTSTASGSESLCELDDESKIVGVIMNRLQRM